MDFAPRATASRDPKRKANRASLFAAGALAAALGAHAADEETGTGDRSPAVVRSATIDGPAYVIASGADTGATEIDGVLLSVETADGFRVYRASRDGLTRTVRVAQDGPPRHLAYDPKRHRFKRLAPSLRVELADDRLLPSVVEAAAGTGGKAFPLLGFAVVHLPPESDPAAALRSVESMPGVIDVKLRIRGARREPR